MLFPTNASAREEARTFDIPSQPLASALLEFARQAGVQVIAPATPLEGVSSQSVSGRMTSARALDRLLEGSGFAGVIEAGALRLEPLAPRTRQARGRSQGEGRRRWMNGPEDIDNIVVVGTRLHGYYPLAYPLQIYDREAIERSGASTSERFIATLTENLATRSQFGPGSAHAVNQEGVNGIDLRGLGVGTSLVLVDGRRLPLAAEGRMADLSFVPLSAIERIEVLTDGASAIYGSDAVGGVVNIVLRRGLDGGEARADFGAVTHGGLREGGASLSLGDTWAQGEAFASLSLRSASALERSERFFAQGGGEGELSPEDQRLTFIGRVSQDLSERLSLSGLAVLGRREVDSEYDVIERSGRQFNHTEANNHLLALEGDYRLSRSWRASAYASFTHNESENEIVAIAGPVVQAIDPSTNYNALDASVQLEGQAVALPGGRGRFSLGAGAMRENFESALTQSDLTREVSYLFGEAALPLLGDGPSRRRLELTLAARYSVYAEEAGQDFGERVSPKIGLAWAAAPWLGLRASYSESFRAPSFSWTELDPGGRFTQVLPLPIAGDPVLALVVFGPGDVGPETAATTTLGFDFAPENGTFSLSATYFDIAYQERVGAPNLAAVLAEPQNYSDVLYAPANAAEIEAFVRHGPNVFNASSVDLSDPAAAAAAFAALSNFRILDNRTRNLGSAHVQGIDLDLGYEADVDWAHLSAGARLTYLMTYDEQRTPGGPSYEVLDTVLYPVDLRAHAFLSLATSEIQTVFSMNYVDGYDNPYAPGGPASIESWLTFDARISLDLGDRDGEGRAPATLSFNVRNIFDEAAPFAATSGVQGEGLRSRNGFDPANADPVGRFIAVELVRRW